MNGQCIAVAIHGETLWLHPQRAVVWPARRTLIVADTHFGKSALFGRHGVAVPAGSDGEDRRRLNRLLQETGAVRLLILGDFLHAPLDDDSRELSELAAWAEGLCTTEIRVIAGNHDRGAAGDPAATLRWQAHGIAWQEEDLREPPFRFTHDADRGPHDPALYALSGHIHPVVRLAGLRKQAPRVPIFWRRSSGLVLPSFGAFTGGYVVRPAPADQIFAVGSQAVVRFR
jgi:DNA ligase-associated metallophosphoesterase